jgi:hypothetical protein
VLLGPEPASPETAKRKASKGKKRLFSGLDSEEEDFNDFIDDSLTKDEPEPKRSRVQSEIEVIDLTGDDDEFLSVAGPSRDDGRVKGLTEGPALFHDRKGKGVADRESDDESRIVEDKATLDDDAMKELFKDGK